MPQVDPPRRAETITRDQWRACHAYKVVGTVPKDQQKDYKIAINGLGADIRRSGLAAAMAAVERLGPRATIVLEHLAAAELPGLQAATGRDLPGRVRKLEVDGYIIATRESLKVVAWLKRATQALFGDQ